MFLGKIASSTSLASRAVSCGGLARDTKRARGPTEFPAWLFLMQHYGLPTRLLDWSESLLTASFFAVFNHREHEHSGCVWVLNPEDK